MDLFVYVCDGCRQIEFATERFEHEPRRHSCNAGKLEFKGMTSIFLLQESKTAEH